MTKEQLGKQIEALRKECGVSTYELEQMGIHPSLPSTIEKGQKGYTIDSLFKYLDAIDEDITLSVGRKENKNERSERLVCSNCKQPFTNEELEVKYHCFNCGWEF